MSVSLLSRCVVLVLATLASASLSATPGQVALDFKDGETPRLLVGEEAMRLKGFPNVAASDLVKNTPHYVLCRPRLPNGGCAPLVGFVGSAAVCLDWRNANVDE